MKTLSCAFNGASGNSSQLEHRWGNPLSVGQCLAKTNKNEIGIHLGSIRTEWSLELAKFLERVLL